MGELVDPVAEAERQAAPFPPVRSHFLAIAEESYDRSTIYGIFDTFEAARDELERLTNLSPAEKSHQEAWGAERATIQEWAGDKRISEMQRDWDSSLLWVDSRF